MKIRQSMLKLPRKFVVIIFGGLLLAQNATAQVTPSHVFQVTDAIRLELELMHEANFSTPSAQVYTAEGKSPRHVIQKAREVLLKVQALKQLKGVATTALKPIEVRVVTPAHVKEAVSNLLEQIQSLRGDFDVEDTAAAAALPAGKTPSDVYQNLMLVGHLIDELGIPNVVPNDVHRLGRAIVMEVERINAHLGVDNSYTISPSAGKLPSAVFEETRATLASLRAAATKHGWNIAGGVVSLPDVQGRVTPGNVLDAMNNVLADLAAIKNLLGLTAPVELPPLISGQTPSDVFDQIAHANALVQRM